MGNGKLEYKVTTTIKELIENIFKCIEEDIQAGVSPTLLNSTNKVITHTKSIRAFQTILSRKIYNFDSKKNMNNYRILYKNRLNKIYET